VDAGYSLIILAFYLSSGPTDVALGWQEGGSSAQQTAIAYAHAHGAKVIVSAGGSSEEPYLSSATTYGQNVANFAVQNHLDGVDFDLENLNTGFTFDSMTANQVISWIVTASNAARSILGSSAIITHAPQAPYFGKVGGGSNSNTWTGSSGGYTAIYEQTSINYLLVQFYNQGSSCYTTYEGLFTTSGYDCSNFPFTSVNEISGYGIPLSKIVVGKPVENSDASNGYVADGTLGTYFKSAQTNIKWSTGVMGWQWHDQTTNQEWISAIY